VRAGRVRANFPTTTMPASSPWLAALLAALAALGPFSIDAYLPAFPDIARSLGATQLQVQQTLTAYMATFAVMVLWHGALSDRFGRRRVIIATLSLFAVSSIVCALAQSIEWLWVGRAMQGLSGGAGMVVGRAVIRDLFEGAQAQRLMSRVMMIFAIAPAVAPMVGGLLLLLAGWRAIFVFLAIFALTLAWLTWRFLPETLPVEARQSLHPLSLGRAYARVLSSGAFLLLAGAVALNFNGFFLYIVSAPVFLMQHLGLGPGEFAWMFVPSVFGLVFGAMVSGKVAGEREAAQRRADAVGLLAERALSAGFGGREVEDEETAAPISGTRAERYQVVLHVETCTLTETEEPGRSELEDGTRVSAETSRRLSCDAGLVRVAHASDGSILDVGRRTRTISPALRRALDIRDRGCRFPGCELRFTDAHHVRHWADGGETSLDNCALLCRLHHRLVHEGGWRMGWWGQGRPVFYDPRGGAHYDGRFATRRELRASEIQGNEPRASTGTSESPMSGPVVERLSSPERSDRGAANPVPT